MPDRDAETQAARNRATQLTVRTPPGFPQRVRDEARARGMSVSAFVVAVIGPELAPQDDAGGNEETGDG